MEYVTAPRGGSVRIRRYLLLYAGCHEGALVECRLFCTGRHEGAPGRVQWAVAAAAAKPSVLPAGSTGMVAAPTP